MSKQFWIFLILGLAVVGVVLSGVLLSTKGAHLDLTGEVLKVRVLALNPKASLVIVDFRVTNPSDVPFVVRAVDMKLDPRSGETTDGRSISKPDVENVFKYEKLLGPKYNDVLSLQDRVNPHQTVDRMSGARFEVPEAVVNSRKGIHLHIEDVDGAMVDITEKK
jgi:hypothetical protein